MEILASRRQLLLLVAAVGPLRGMGDNFWDSKPSSSWDLGEVYRLLNHSPWAKQTEWAGPLARHTPRPLVKTVVTVESALPVREIRRVSAAPIHDRCYVMGIDGIPPVDYSPTDLGEFATLRATGKPKWVVNAASAREIDRSSPICELAFSREAAPIGPDTKALVLEIIVPFWSLHVVFDVRAMRYRGSLSV
jgi:hypothetical protein